MNLFAQMPGGSGRGMGGQNMNVGHFYGKLVDETTGKPIESASVQLIQNKWDSIEKKRKDHVIAIKISDKKGEFSIDNLPVMASFKLKISAVGFKLYEQKVSFELNMAAAKNGDFSSMLNGVDKDLGNIKLSIDAQQLQNVTVSASKPLVQLYLDKKVYNVEKDISATGGTAVDVMKNVPSVSVDIDGNVSLRNAPPQIFVDGRPSSLTLDQIPADQIASVEIMTNPSAKYDASGGGSGILNIVLKKNRRMGYNGNIRAGIDSRGRPGFGGDINVKQNKINLFAAGMFNMRKSITSVSSMRTDFSGANMAHLNQFNHPINRGFFAFGRLGFDYFMDNRNTLTISGNIVRGQFKSKDLISIYRDTVKPAETIIETGNRNIMAVTDFKNYGSSLSFKHNFAKPGKEFTADFNFNYSNNFNTSDYNSQYYDAQMLPKSSLNVERSSGGGTSRFYTIQSDFVNPFAQNKKIETGVRVSLRNYNSNNDNFIMDMSGNYIYIPSLNVKYKYNDVVYAAYGTYSQQIKDFSYQVGLRLESSDYKGDLLNKVQHFSNNYPVSLFPSIYLTQKINKKTDLQLNYSRKINRPNFFQLIPFIDFSDSLNLSVGNPNLVPEFTNLLEFTYQNQYKNNNSVLLSFYGRLTNDLITRYQYRSANPNPTKTDSVLFTSYANANRSYTYGLEITGKNKLAKWWDLTTNVNLFNATIEAANLPGASDNSQFSWFAKINSNFKLPKNFSIQLNGDYQARTLVPVNSGGRGGMMGGGMFGGGSQPTAQGYIKPVYGMDISIRKDFLKNNAASLTLQFSDIFRTKTYETHSESAYFIQDNFRRRDPQVLRLNFNWRFGKFDVALFKRKNMKGEMENMQNMQQQGQGQ